MVWSKEYFKKILDGVEINYLIDFNEIKEA